ncbi:MAG TPA: hypothetical protein VIZ21_05580, partial [Ignavibacteriaceae bacterium]
MDKFDKILELLEKKSLTEVEKKLLAEFSNSDDEIKSFVSSYKTLSNTLSTSGHISPDLLASYIIFERGDDSENNIVAILKEKIKSHLEVCEDCKTEYNVLKNEYSDIEQHV